MSDLARGALLAGRFVIEGEPLAEGGTGTVWPAWDEVASRPVAVKVLHGHLLRDPVALGRLQAEAGAACRLQHPNLLVVHGLWSHEGRWLLAEERLDGPALSAAGVAPLSTGSTVAIGLQLLQALLALHDAGFVHGDLRPGHVVLADRGAVLLGFGQVVAGSSARPGQTAPEVAQGGPPRTPADLYGLGVTLHYALTGRLPFEGNSPWQVLGQQRSRRLEHPPGPCGLATFLVDLLHPDADRRPSLQVARHVLRRLQEEPDRPVRWRASVAPVRFGGAWAVHGTDPETGAPALVTAGMPRGRARRLVARLRAQGWDVRADPEGLTGPGLLAIVAGAAVAGTVVPVVGLPVGAWLVARGLSARTRPALSAALPPVRAPVPPRVLPAGREHALGAGILLLAAAGLLAIKPALALIPGVLFAWLVVATWRQRRRDAAADVLRSRIAGAFAEVRHGLEARDLPLDDGLAILGEAEVLEAGWRAGRVPADVALSGAEALVERAAAGALRPEPSVEGVREALRRTRLDVPTS